MIDSLSKQETNPLCRLESLDHRLTCRGWETGYNQEKHCSQGQGRSLLDRLEYSPSEYRKKLHHYNCEQECD